VLPQPTDADEQTDPRQARTNSLAADVRRAATRRQLRHAGALLLQLLVLAALMMLFFVRTPQVDGHSMAPQVDSGDHVAINTLAYDLRIVRPGGADPPLLDVRLRAVSRGDVVAFEHGSGDDKRIYLKRVIGLPSETIAMERGIVSVNGTTLRESYDPQLDVTDMRPLVVPPDSLFVLGDNRGDSNDSRSFGPIPIRAVIGRAALVVWPPDRVRPIH
jgi:signal peptidase I